MFMYNEEGQQALVGPDQVATLEAAGWSKNPPVASEGKAVPEKTETPAEVDKTVGKKILLKR